LINEVYPLKAALLLYPNWRLLIGRVWWRVE